MTRPRPWWRCTCDTKLCACTWVLTLSRTNLPIDFLVGMRYTILVQHPGLYGVLGNLYYANTRAGVIRKASKRLPPGAEFEVVEE